MLCVRALVRALNDAKNYAQQGCAMQFNGITLTSILAVFELQLLMHARATSHIRACVPGSVFQRFSPH